MLVAASLTTADWFSPGEEQWPDLKANPRAVNGRKVSLVDTDHVYGVGGDQQWIWKCFLRGHKVLFMDPCAANGKFLVEWCHPVTGTVTPADLVEGGTKRSFTSPIPGEAVPYLHR